MKELIAEYLKKVDLMKTITGLIVLLIFSFLVFKLVTKELPEANREVVVHVLGIIEGAVMGVVTYYYGSSKGSQEKSHQIQSMTDKK